jgi:hypothetical protein
MTKFAWIRVVLSVVVGLGIGIVVTALINLFIPIANLAWTILAVCVSSTASSLLGYLLGARSKKENA